MAPLANFFCIELFDGFFFEPVGDFLPIQDKLLRISNLLFRFKHFPRTLFLPYHHLLWALQLRPPEHENSVPGMVFGSRRDLLRTNFEATRSPQKIM